MLRYKKEYFDAKDYVMDTFDSYGFNSSEDEDLGIEDEFFTCPECGDPLYAVDYDYPTSWSENYGKPWSYCPVCDYDWYNDNYGDYEDGNEVIYDDEV